MPTKYALMIQGMPDGRRTPYDGQYIKTFDFEFANGQGYADFTTDPKEALHFNTMEEAFEFYKRSPKCKPIRPDGRPNRPVTATNISFEQVVV